MCKSPATDKLFQVNESSPKLSPDRAEKFHSMAAKALFLGKRGRPDIQPVVTFLCTRVKSPTVDDWAKLHRMMQWLKATKEDLLTLQLAHPDTIHWYLMRPLLSILT